MATIHTLQEITKAISGVNLTPYIEQGFIAYSNNEVIVPPVGELIFDNPPGDTHIKYGFIKGDDIYVIKIASGFYNNPALGLSSSSGLMLVFSQKTGILHNILLDDGHLTNIRTAIAGEIAAKYLAPKTINGIGVLGTGIQARMQVEYLNSVTPCREIVVWGRTAERVEEYASYMENRGYNITQANSPAQVANSANLIVTTTPSSTPLLFEGDIQPGTHITAMGSDTDKKQELDLHILGRADIVVGDSISQCRERGEISKALAAGVIEEKHIVELGNYIANPSPRKRDDKAITVVDLTGVAIQDIQIAAAVCEKLTQENREPGSRVG